MHLGSTYVGDDEVSSTPSEDLLQSKDQNEKGDRVQQLTTDIQPVDVPPNGGYGWVCVACSALINAHTWGLNSVRYPLTT